MSNDPVFSVHEFEFLTKDPTGEPGPWKISSVVTSQEDFNEFLVDVAAFDGYDYKRGQRGGVDVEGLRAVGSVPLIKRGTKTQFAFDRYGVTTDYMSVIVRGQGMEVAKRMMGADPRFSPQVGRA
jgi:hypothetical protein